MLQSPQSQADADDDPAAEEARAEKEEAPGSWMILDVCRNTRHERLGPVAGCKVLNETMGKAKQARQVLRGNDGQRGNVATACNCYFFLGGIRK